MTKSSYKIWETVILIISALMALIYWILSATGTVEFPRKTPAVIFMVMAGAFFPRPIRLLSQIGKFTERAEAITVKCRSQHVGRTHFKTCTLEFSDSKGNICKMDSDSYAFALSKEGKRHIIRFAPSAPNEFIVVPYAYFQSAAFAVLGMFIEVILILVMINAKG